MSTNTLFAIFIAAGLTAGIVHEVLDARRPEPTNTARLKCPTIERVAISAPIDGVVSIVCRAQ